MKKKKVGIITFYRTYNYGSVLQAFALSSSIQKLGYDAALVNYYNKTIYNSIIKIKNYKNKVILCIRHPNLIKKLVEYRTISRQSISTQTDKAKLKYDDFINEYIPAYNNDFIKNASTDFFAFVCGSDQIWNIDGVGLSELYYLRFAPESSRIAYAPSFGSIQIPKYNLMRLKRYLLEIPSLSAREITGVDIIRQCTGREEKCVLDPVLLAGKVFWGNFIKKTDKEYIVCYFLGDASEAYKVIDALQKKIHTDVIWICSSNKLEGKPYQQIEAAPLEFVSLIQNAEFVCTDSFHATAFSVMLETPFFVFERKYKIANGQGARIDSFLSLVQLENRKYNEAEGEMDITKSIDFSYAKSALEKSRKESLKYLENALKKARESANCK